MTRLRRRWRSLNSVTLVQRSHRFLNTQGEALLLDCNLQFDELQFVGLLD